MKTESKEAASAGDQRFPSSPALGLTSQLFPEPSGLDRSGRLGLRSHPSVTVTRLILTAKEEDTHGLTPPA